MHYPVFPLSVILFLGGVVHQAARASDEIGMYDLRYTITSDFKDRDKRNETWDHCHAVATLQGIVNRDHPRLYLLYVQSQILEGKNVDQYWFDKHTGPDGWLAGRPVKHYTDIRALFAAYRTFIDGAVVYDPKVPATSNVASTIAGVENLVAIRYDLSPNSLYSALITSGPKLPVKQWLVNPDGSSMFTGNGILPGSDLPSSGSAKCDAYLWMHEHYLKTQKCNSAYGAYYIDSYWLQNPGAAVPNHHTLANHDFFVSKRAFFFDLSPWGDEPPNDDPTQPLGSDLSTLKTLLHRAWVNTGGKAMIQYGGFPPWAFKYTDWQNVGGKHGGVPTEWEYTRLVSAYNGLKDADAISFGALANSSFWQHYPLKDQYPQQDMTDERLRERGYLTEDGTVNFDGRDFVIFYVGDYDSAAWVSQRMMDIWDDPARGEVPLMWCVSPVLDRRVPMAMAYMRDTATANDYFAAADSGAGYINPGMLQEPRPISGLPSGVDLWAEHCKPYYHRWDLDITGFVIDGYAPGLDPKGLEAYASFSPNGIVPQKCPLTLLHGDMPVMRADHDVNENDPRDAAAHLVRRVAQRPVPFHWFRNILKTPGWYMEVREALQEIAPNIELLDAPTFFALYRIFLKNNPQAAAGGINMTDYTQYVNIEQGTQSTRKFSRGLTLPLVSTPWAMTSWTPQTSFDEAEIFRPDLTTFTGIRATRQPSIWMEDYGHFSIMPFTGTFLADPEQYASPYRHQAALFSPNRFSCRLLRYDIDLDIAPTPRCAVMDVHYPTNQSPRLVFQTFPGESSFTIDVDNNTLSGYTRANHGGVTDNFAQYVYVEFSTDVLADQSGVVVSRQLKEGILTGTGEQLCAVITLAGSMISLNIGTSFISVEQAKLNLHREIGDRALPAVSKETRDLWNKHLSRIQIETEDEQRKTTFYSCFYRALLFPRQLHEFNEAGDPIHYSPYDGQIHPGVLSADNGFWDTHRTVYPFYSIMFQDKLRELLAGWLNAYREGEWLPKWSSPGYRDCMISTHMDVIFADAIRKGILTHDLQTAYQAIRKNAFEPSAFRGVGREGLTDYHQLGYVGADTVKESASRTLDFAHCDWAIAQVARQLGHDDDFTLLIQRAGNYVNLFDPERGFVRGRNRDGSWCEPFSPIRWGGPFVEGSAWQCGWGVNHDPAGLIHLLGGNEAAVAKLDTMLATPPRFDVGSYQAEIHEMSEMAAVDFGQYGQNNQPSHHVLYFYTAAGRPDKTQYWTRRVLDELYSPDHFPGDEDNGEMACWYIFNSLGLYPFCPGQPEYVLSSPQWDKATLYLEKERPFTIESRNNSNASPYVAQRTLNGSPHTRLVIDHDQLVGGGTLIIEHSATPCFETTYANEDLPYSLSNRP